MNVIRTKTVELEAAPALAYRFKRKSGGAGLAIVDIESGAIATAEIDKRGGQATNIRNQGGSFGEEVWDEALALTLGMPYCSRGKVIGKIRSGVISSAGADEMKNAIDEETEAGQDTPDMTERPEYLAIIEKFTNKKTGKFDYELLNKDFIQFTVRSLVTFKMVAEKKSGQEILDYVLKSRMAEISKQPNLTDEEVAGITAALDAIYVKSVFKGLKMHIRRMLSVTKNLPI